MQTQNALFQAWLLTYYFGFNVGEINFFMRVWFNLTIDFTIWHVRHINFSNNNLSNKQMIIRCLISDLELMILVILVIFSVTSSSVRHWHIDFINWDKECLEMIIGYPCWLLVFFAFSAKTSIIQVCSWLDTCEPTVLLTPLVNKNRLYSTNTDFQDWEKCDIT